MLSLLLEVQRQQATGGGKTSGLMGCADENPTKWNSLSAVFTDDPKGHQGDLGRKIRVLKFTATQTSFQLRSDGTGEEYKEYEK